MPPNGIQIQHGQIWSFSIVQLWAPHATGQKVVEMLEKRKETDGSNGFDRTDCLYTLILV